MKKLLIPALMGLAALVSTPARALTTTDDFTVTVNLYPRCIFSTAPTNLALNYVSLQSTPSVNTHGFAVQCTQTLPYTIALGGTSPGGGTLVGLTYTLALPVTSGLGDGTAQPYNIEGTIAAGQAGTCAQANTGVVAEQVASANGASTGLGTACSGLSAGGAHTVVISY